MNKETNDNNNSTYLQSTKAYRTKACLLGVLLAFTFVIREFFIYNIQLGFAEYNGVDRHSFIDWLAVYRNYDGMFFLGLLIFLIPYEWIAERLKSKMDRVTEKTVHAKKPILFVAMLAMLLIMGLTALCVRSSYQWAFVICGVGISFLICLKAGKLFETETSWLLYAAMAMSCRLVSKRSKQRAVIVCWCMIIAIAFLIVDILSHLGVITQLMNDSISFDGALVMLMFIVIRSFAGCDKPQR